MQLDEPLQRSRGHQLPQRSLNHQFGDIGNVLHAHETAAAIGRITVAEHHVRHGLVRQRIEQGRVVGGQQDTQSASVGNRADGIQQMPRPARMHAVVDLLDHHEATLWSRQHGRGDGEHTQGAIGQQRRVIRGRRTSEGFQQLHHHLATRSFQKGQACDVLLGQALDEAQDRLPLGTERLGMRLRIAPPQTEQDAGQVRPISQQALVGDEAVLAHPGRHRIQEQHIRQQRLVAQGNRGNGLLRLVVSGGESCRTLELDKRRHLVTDRDMRLVSPAGEVVVGHTGIRADACGGLVHVIQRNAPRGMLDLLRTDVQFTAAQADRHGQSAPFGIVCDATQPELHLPPIAKVLDPSAHDTVGTVDGVLDGAQLLSLGQPAEQAQGFDDIALAGCIGTDQHRQRSERQGRLAPKALEITTGKGGQHGAILCSARAMRERRAGQDFAPTWRPHLRTLTSPAAPPSRHTAWAAGGRSRPAWRCADPGPPAPRRSAPPRPPRR